MSQCLTGKTIGELSTLSGLSGNTLFIVEQDGITYNIPFSAFGIDVNSCLTEILTYSQMTGETSTNSLKPGCFYMITDADPTLYSGGTNIVIQAITNNQLALQGHGLFYTPPYDQNVSGFNVWYSGGTYGIGNVAYWGGYVWENLTGSVGSSTDIYTLDGTNWSAKTYNYSGYNTSIDVIHYDYDNNIIIYRKDKSNNEVSVSKSVIDYFVGNFGVNPINSFQWGNPFDTTLSLGVSGNHMIDSVFECINFRGGNLYFNTLEKLSYIINNSWEDVSSFQGNTLDNNSSFIANTLNNNSHFYSNILDGGYFDSNTLDNGSYFQQNTLDNGSYFQYNTLDNGSYFQQNTLDNSSFQYNTLDNGSYFNSNTLTESLITQNILVSGSIYSNILTKPTPAF